MWYSQISWFSWCTMIKNKTANNSLLPKVIYQGFYWASDIIFMCNSSLVLDHFTDHTIEYVVIKIYISICFEAQFDCIDLAGLECPV